MRVVEDLRLAVVACLVGAPAIADTQPAAYLACGGALAQGGLVVCRSEPGARLDIGGTPSVAGDDGLALVGLRRDAPERVSVVAQTPDGRTETLDLEIAQRNDPYRLLEGLDCDKVDARTKAQKAHAARSWVKKQDAFGAFRAPADALNGFSSPAQGRVSSPFGPTRTYVGVSAQTGEACEKTSVHQGYDIAAPIGAPITAPAGGVVTLADADLYYEGGTVFLDHGRGLVSVFMHMSAVDVSAGETVSAGDRLGAVGNTGRTTGPHLHWAVKWRDAAREDRSGDFYIDPALLLDLDLPPG